MGLGFVYTNVRRYWKTNQIKEMVKNLTIEIKNFIYKINEFNGDDIKWDVIVWGFIFGLRLCV